jgi:hypothetical protein
MIEIHIEEKVNLLILEAEFSPKPAHAYELRR